MLRRPALLIACSHMQSAHATVPYQPLQPCALSRCKHSSQPPQPYAIRCCGISPWYGCLGCLALGLLASVMGSAMLAQDRYTGPVHTCQPRSYAHNVLAMHAHMHVHMHVHMHIAGPLHGLRRGLLPRRRL